MSYSEKSKKQQHKVSERREDVAEASVQVPVSRQDESMPVEIGGVEGPEPTRFGDWERNGRCSDF